MTTYDLAVIFHCPDCGKLSVLPNPTAIALALMGSTMEVSRPCKCKEETVEINPGRQMDLPDPEDIVKMGGKVTLA